MKIARYCLLLIISVMCSACTTQQPLFDTDITIIVDRTDPMALYPTAEAVTAPLGLNRNPWQGVRVAVTYISDRDINQTSMVTLDRESEWSCNLTIRKAKVQHFVRQLHHCLTGVKSANFCQHSIIYRTIARQANMLAASLAPAKYLLVYSNLYENDEVNFYDPQLFDMIRNSPQSIQKRLGAATPIGALTGLQVWLLFNPVSYKENNNYMVLAGFYQHLLQEHGATVHIGNKFMAL
jgi:hypothetical protein